MLKALAGGIILYAIVIMLTSVIKDTASVILLLNIILGSIIIGCTDIIIRTIKEHSNKDNK